MAEQLLVGKLLRESRKSRNITLKDVCRNPAEVAMLSRLETGRHTPGWKQVEAFFDRLGMSLPKNVLSVTKADFDRYNLELRIMDSIASRHHEIKELLEAYRDIPQKMDTYMEQFYTFYTTVYDIYHGGDTCAIMEQLVNAMHLTNPIFVLDKEIGTQYLSIQEILIISEISGMEFYTLGKTDAALIYMEYLKKYIEEKIHDDKLKANLYSVTLYNLSNYKGLMGQYAEALALAENGIKICNQHGKLFNFPHLVFNKGYCLSYLNRMSEGKKWITYAIHMMEETGLHQDALLGIEESNKRFGFHLSIT